MLFAKSSLFLYKISKVIVMEIMKNKTKKKKKNNVVNHQIF